jgi:peptidoglycan/xylan/chitin deacetylase (PgdA/CDA1 family)
MNKIIATIIIAAVIFTLINGMSILKNSYYWKSAFFIMQWDYLKNKLAFVNYSGAGNWLALFKDEGMNKTSGQRKTDSIPVLLYHGVINKSGWQPDDVSIRLEDFRQQMFALKKAGYQTIALGDYLAFSRGEKQLPEKSFMLTFDDGRKDSYYPVDPILRVLNYSAIMNVITSRSLEKNNEKSTFHLSKMELEKMIESGRWQIESHGRDDHDYQKIGPKGEQGYFLTNKIWLDQENRLENENEFRKRIYADLINSHKDIESELGVKVLAFAYPFGNFGQETENFPGSRDILISLVKSAYTLSFVQAGSSDFSTNYPERSFMAKRISITSRISAEQLIGMLKNSESKAINYLDNFSNDRGWLKGWGTVAVANGKMTVGDSADEDSGLAFLDGSYLWKDYSANSEVHIARGNAFAISARYEDENNYVACDFADGHVALSQRVNGQDKPDIEILGNNNLSSGRIIRAGIFVSENQAGCYLDGKLMVSGTVDDELEHGGISFKVWNTGQKGSQIIINNLKVEGN